MLQLRYADETHASFWLSLDSHIARPELLRKMAARQCYLLAEDGAPVGVMRYNLFWDSIPFLTMLYLAQPHRGAGRGRQAMAHWEAEMQRAGYRWAMTSTQADEEAQHFYRKLGYKDAGCLLLDLPGLSQPLEILMIKAL